MARVVFNKVCTANSDVRFSACAVPHVSSEKETRSKSLRRSRQRKLILCGSSASPRLMMEA